MKKLLLLLLLISNLAIGEEFECRSLRLILDELRVVDKDVKDKLKAASKIVNTEKARRLVREYDWTKKNSEYCNKKRVEIETKCAYKSSKSSNEFSARKIYSNCLQNNNYYNK